MVLRLIYNRTRNTPSLEKNCWLLYIWNQLRNDFIVSKAMIKPCIFVETIFVAIMTFAWLNMTVLLFHDHVPHWQILKMFSPDVWYKINMHSFAHQYHIIAIYKINCFKTLVVRYSNWQLFVQTDLKEISSVVKNARRTRDRIKLYAIYGLLLFSFRDVR